MYLLKKYISKLDKAYTISFDMYDTLIHRNVRLPENIFKKIEYDLHKRGIKEEFCVERLRAEKLAREKTDKEEVTLEEIYKEYRCRLVERNILMNIEMEEEILAAYPDKKMLAIWNYCLNNKRRVVITTDMYLPRNVLERILNDCGYRGYSNIYISHELDARKRTGRIYKIIKEKEGNNILHIGDTYMSDICIPKKIGILTFWIPFPEIRRRILRIFQ